MKKQLIIIAVFTVFSFANASRNPEPTIDELKNKIYDLTQKIKMYKTELKKKDKTIKSQRVTIFKMISMITALKTNSHSKTPISSKSYTKRLAEQRSHQKKQRKEQYKKLIASNNIKLKLYEKQKSDYLKQLRAAEKEYKKATQMIGKSKRKTATKRWQSKINSIDYKLKSLYKQISSLEQINAMHAVYAK